jgi:iron(III) transport system substrate-binding protein
MVWTFADSVLGFVWDLMLGIWCLGLYRCLGFRRGADKLLRSLGVFTWILLSLLLSSCGRSDSFPDDARTRAADEKVRAAWGKGLAELPTLTLSVLSPNNENIRNEYEWAFSLHHAVQYGQKVVFEWRTVAGGSGTILQYLQNVYRDPNVASANIDIFWGGGDDQFNSVAALGALEPLKLAPDVLQNVPAMLGPVRLVEPNQLWVGSCLSAFGYVYNAEMIRRCHIAPPNGTWEDLASPRFANLVSLADPMQSGSAAAAYQMIVRSGEDWPLGWAKLLGILANAKRFTDSAGTSANAPSLGEALVAACIDFYGAVRVAEDPKGIVYVNPRGQTAFTPDPVAILKNPPHPELARRFVDFLLSVKGQALWALPVGAEDGPARSVLGRQPIRQDVYEIYRGKLIPSIVSPYQAGPALSMAGFRSKINFEVLKRLVVTAAVDNADDLRAAREAILRAGSPPDLLADYYRLPENVDAVEKMPAVAKDLKDPAKGYAIMKDWQTFFREKYQRLQKEAGERGAGNRQQATGNRGTEDKRRTEN